MKQIVFLCFLMIVSACILVHPAQGQQESSIVHDAEYYILEAQHGTKWAAEDKELDDKLSVLKEKFGIPPNIVYVLFDDVALPAIQKFRGFETPNLKKLANEGWYAS